MAMGLCQRSEVPFKQCAHLAHCFGHDGVDVLFHETICVVAAISDGEKAGTSGSTSLCIGDF